MLLLYLPIIITLFKISLSFPQQNPDLSSLLSNYEVDESFDENFESWDNNNNDVIVFETLAEEDLNKLCKNSNAVIYIKQEDIVFDCKLLDVNQVEEKPHEIVKRFVNEEEGSGTGPEIIEEIPTTISPSVETDKIVDEPIVETEHHNNENVETKETINPSVEIEKSDNETIIETELHNNENVEITEKSDEDVTNEPSTTENTIIELETTKISEDTPKLAPDTVDGNTSTNKTEKEKEAEAENATEQENTQTIIPEKEVENTPLADGDKPTVSPTDKIEWLPKTNENNTGSGRSLINTNKETPKDEDRVVESKEPQKAASKDTTILVVLFAAVVVVGAAAFAYNFFKKRRQNNADAERLERAVNGKRNTNNVNNEPEEKPLMAEKKEVEMVDFTKNGNESNDGTVKT